MNIIKVKNYSELSRIASEIFMKQMKKLDNPVIGLATGSTPIKLYKILVEYHQKGELSFSNTITFNLDEYVGLSKNDPTSYQYFMYEHLFRHVDIKEENIHLPDGLTEDLEEECNKYEELIKKAGNIDLQILGLGLNGHIGFNEPGTSFSSRTHVVELQPSTIKANSRFFSSIENVPKKAITMGISTIMEAKKIIFLVQGEMKAEILKKVVYGEVSEDVPASILQRHPNVTLITDIDV